METEILITPKLKCICINLTKYVKDMYAGYYSTKYWRKKSKMCCMSMLCQFLKNQR